MNLINASDGAEYQEFLVETESQVYKIYFHKKLGVSSWVCLKGTENKEEIKQILEKLDDFRLTLAETEEESFVKSILKE